MTFKDLDERHAICDAHTLGLPKMGLLGVQHMFAMFGATILVPTLGIAFSKAGAIKFACGGVNISLSGLAVGAIIGIALNALLPGKDFAFSETDPSIKDAERWGGVKADGK